MRVAELGSSDRTSTIVTRASWISLGNCSEYSPSEEDGESEVKLHVESRELRVGSESSEEMFENLRREADEKELQNYV